MWNTPGKSELKFQLKRLLKEQGTAVKTKTLEDSLKTIETWSPWFITSGALNISEWEQVRGDLQKTLRKEGPEVLPIAMFSLWRLIRDALLTEKVRVKQALKATKLAQPGKVEEQRIKKKKPPDREGQMSHGTEFPLRI